MLLYIIFSFFFLKGNANKLEIAYGTAAREREFPYIVTILRSNDHVCGGSIINKNFILTAAHCVCNRNSPYPVKYYKIKYGKVDIKPLNTNMRTIKKIYCADFDPDEIINDIALLELSTSLPNDNTWIGIRYSTDYDSSKKYTTVIAGWGQNEKGGYPNNLHKIIMDVYSKSECSQNYNPKHIDQYICFGKSSPGGGCEADSGGPLMINGKLAGVISYKTAKCGTANVNTPNIAIKINQFREWIKGIV